MALVWGIDPHGDVICTVHSNGSEHIAQVAIGYDDSSNCTISLAVIFTPVPTGEHEHAFCVVEADPDSPYEHRYWDGQDTVNLFNKEDREAVLVIFCALLDQLLSTIRPPCLHHNIATPNLPPRALKKHALLLSIFVRYGYQVRRGETRHGRMAFIAELPN